MRAPTPAFPAVVSTYSPSPVLAAALLFTACAAEAPPVAPRSTPPSPSLAEDAPAPATCEELGSRAEAFTRALASGSWAAVRPFVRGPLAIEIRDTDVDPPDDVHRTSLTGLDDVERWFTEAGRTWAACEGSSEPRCLYSALAMAAGHDEPECRAGCYDAVPGGDFVTTHRALYVRRVCFRSSAVTSVLFYDGD
jgi:hypothetical protein